MNKSQVPIKFRIYCPDDGRDEPLTCYDYANTKRSPAINPKEFSYSMPTGIVYPLENMKVEVRLLICLIVNYLQIEIRYLF